MTTQHYPQGYTYSSIEKTCLPKNSVANLPQIPPLECPPGTFKHRARNHRRPGQTPRHNLVRWQHRSLSVFVIIIFDLIEFATSPQHQRRERRHVHRRRSVIPRARTGRSNRQQALRRRLRNRRD